MIRKKAWTCAQQVWKDGGLASEHQPPPGPLEGRIPRTKAIVIPWDQTPNTPVVKWVINSVCQVRASTTSASTSNEYILFSAKAKLRVSLELCDGSNYKLCH